MTLVGQKVGHIRIERPLGRGGMGEVYLGFDEKLERRVALKVLREDYRLRESSKARFLREARLLSRLDHPHICRIHDYVEGDEAAFLVLELIDGRGLGKRIREGLEHPEKIRIAEQINSALVAAHSSGVIHRDLKPGNVMLTRDGEVKVLDFGLARSAEALPVEESVGADDWTVLEPDDTTREAHLETYDMEPTAPRTASGALLGTPSFMSPEQARGEPATSASDMYSFGLLLQSLYTERLPYESGLDPSLLLQKAQLGQTLPVTGVDSDLAKLIGRLKSMAPARRPTAVEAAERLRWIREKPKRRIRKLVAAGVLIIAALAGTKYTLDLRHQRGLALEARDAAQRHRAQADGLIGFMLGDLRAKLEPLGRLNILDDVGDEALAHFESLEKETLTETELFRHSKLLRQIGEVRIAQGNLDAALAAFQESLAQAEHLAQRDPLNGKWQKGLGEAHFYVGLVHWERNDVDGAVVHFEMYRSIAEQLVAREPDEEEWQQELAYAHSNMASVLEARGDSSGALVEYRGTLAMKKALLERAPGDAARRHSLAVTQEDIGQVLRMLGRFGEAEGNLRQAVSIREALLAEEPDNAERLENLGVSQFMLGALFESIEDTESALVQHRAALDTSMRLAAQDPDNSVWKRSVAVSHGQVGYMLAARDPAKAMEHLEISLNILQKLVAQDPTNVSWDRDLAVLTTKKGLALEEQGKIDEALRTVGRAEQALEALHRNHPEDRDVRRWLGKAYLMEGRLLESRARRDSALQAWQRALTVIESLPQDSRETWILDIWARALLQLDRLEEAEPVVRELLDRGYRSKRFLDLCHGKGVVR
jgi:serine/threonine-protein kinase